MRLKGVTYDVGTEMGGNWRPDFDPRIVHRELEIIKNDLHCNAIRITGFDIQRLVATARDALVQGLEVWICPLLWNRSPKQTLDYTTQTATEVEKLRKDWPDQIVFSVGSEFTLFMRGIIEGGTLTKRIRKALFGKDIIEGKHNKPLNDYLTKASESVRKVFHGKITYASLVWEQVEWNLFDLVGIDHYWSERIKDRYIDMLKPAFEFGKPVVITEFGFKTTKEIPQKGALGLGNVNNTTRLLHMLPVVGKFIKPRLSKIYERDETLQAERLIEQLKLLETTDVEGGFISTFTFPLNPYDEKPKYDLDRESFSLVKYMNGKRGITYPDMSWEPKESFKAVSDFYANNKE